MQPEYGTTFGIYQYLKVNSDDTGKVSESLRSIARSMGYRSWSVIQWHILALERAELITRDTTGPPTPAQGAHQAHEPLGQGRVPPDHQHTTGSVEEEG